MYILEDAHNHDQNSIIHSWRSYLNVKHVLHDRLHMMKSLHPYLLESLVVAYSYGDGLEHTSFFHFKLYQQTNWFRLIYLSSAQTKRKSEDNDIHLNGRMKPVFESKTKLHL